MKVTLFIGGLSGGGAEKTVCELANFLTDRGYQVTALTMSETKPHIKLDDAVECLALLKHSERGNFLLNNIKRWLRLSKYVRKNPCDTYIVMLPITTLLLLLMRRKIKGAIVASERSDPDRYSLIVISLMKLLIGRTDAFVAQTPQVIEYYRGFLKGCEKEVIPNGVSMTWENSEVGWTKEKEILAAGRLIEVKNYSMLIRSFEKVVSAFPEYHLTICGEGEKRSELESLVEDLGLKGKVELPGNVDDLRDRMKRAELFVLSSDHEGMPNVILEAMAEGMPVISTDCPVGGPAYLINDGQNGCLVPVGDEKALAEKMLYLLKNKKTALKIGIAAKTRASEFEQSIIMNMWLDLVKKLEGAHSA